MTSRDVVKLTLVLCLVCGVARASPADEYGALPRAMGTAGAQTALGTDTGAAFYNPANLALAGEGGHPSIQVGYVHAVPGLFISRLKNDPTSVPNVNPTNQGWVMAGALLPIGGKVQNA